VLQILDLEKDFTIFMDACQEGVGDVLMHEGKVINYQSYKLNENDHPYSAYDMELSSIVHALKVWRYYLLRKNIFINDRS